MRRRSTRSLTRPRSSKTAGVQTINLTGISAGGCESQTLTVTATSSDPSLIPHPTVSYTSPGARVPLSYIPVGNQSGTVVITVTVTDNGGTADGGVDTFTHFHRDGDRRERRTNA